MQAKKLLYNYGHIFIWIFSCFGLNDVFFFITPEYFLVATIFVECFCTLIMSLAIV